MNLHKQMINRLSVLAMLLLSLQHTFAQSLASDTSKINEVLIQGNRLQIPVSKNSRNIEIITKEEIRKLPARTINEVLGFINGVDLRQRGPLGTQADIGIDGGSFEQTLVLINGIKVSDPQTGHHNLNIPIPSEAIERIEVLRGPASRIYGVNGLTGSVNIVTRSVDESGVFAHMYGGSSFKKVEEEDGRSGVYQGNGVQLGGQFAQKNHKHQLYLTREQSNGQRYNSASENYRVFYQNQISINENHSFEMMASHINSAFGANGFYAAPGDRESEEMVKTSLFSLASNHKTSEKFFFSPRISYRHNKDDYRYFRHDLSKARSQHTTEVFSAELNGRYHTSIGDVGIGAEARFEDIESTNIGDHKRRNFGYYAEFRTEQITNLILNVGAYINHNTQYGWQVFPGIDVGYFINENWQLAVNAGSSQRIPSFTDLYLNQAPGNIGNPLLVSENAWQAESMIKYRNGGFSAQTGYFYRNVKDFIDWQRESTAVPYQPFNIDNNKIQGWNTAFKYQGNTTASNLGYNLAVGYSYLNPSVISRVGEVISKYAIENLKHQVNTVINLHYNQFAFTTANRFIERASAKSYFISDLRLAYNVRHFVVYTDVQNLFDVTYIEAGAVPMPGRWFSLGVRYNWER